VFIFYVQCVDVYTLATSMFTPYPQTTRKKIKICGDMDLGFNTKYRKIDENVNMSTLL
jgi:hypothetical protein